MPDLDRLTRRERELYETGLAEGRALVPVPMHEATVVGPTAAETVAESRSMRPSWKRGEFWLVVSFQFYITWLGVLVGRALVNKFVASEAIDAPALITAVGAISAIVGTIPLLYLRYRIGERKSVAQEASPLVMVDRPPHRGPPERP